MSTRMKDIAQDLNVSVVTVSKVLRNHSDISTATRERVLQRMKELNYRPNLAARTLVTGRTYMIGLVVPGLMHPFFVEVAKALSSQIRPKGYSLVISSSEEDPDLEKQEIDLLLSRQVDALVVASAQSTTASFQEIEARKIPYVLIDRLLTGLNANFIGVDDEQVGFLATQHLIETGYARIAHIRGPELSTGIARFNGYCRALQQSRRHVPPEYVVAETAIDDSGEQSGFDAMQQLLARSPRPDAVFCFNDPVAIGAMKAILAAGLRIPHDIALIGAGNNLHTDLLRVGLSTIDQATADIGLRAAKLVLKLIESKSPGRPKTVLLPPSLIIRESTRRP
jgi:LacI family transcriptional regulator